MAPLLLDIFRARMLGCDRIAEWAPEGFRTRREAIGAREPDFLMTCSLKRRGCRRKRRVLSRARPRQNKNIVRLVVVPIIVASLAARAMSWRERLGFPDGDGRASLGAAATLLAGLACAFVFLRGVPSAMRAPRRYRTVASDADARRERYAVVGKLPNPALGDIPTLVAEMRDAFESGVTLPIANRRETLRAMLALVVENERLILDAVWEDLKRPTGETLY